MSDQYLPGDDPVDEPKTLQPTEDPGWAAFYAKWLTVKRNNATSRVVDDVRAERLRQDAMFGHEQTLPNGTADGSFNWALVRDAWQQHVDSRMKSSDLAWLPLLLEEVFEAAAEPDPTKLREELVQVAAVAVMWAEALDRAAVDG